MPDPKAWQAPHFGSMQLGKGVALVGIFQRERGSCFSFDQMCTEAKWQSHGTS